MHININKNKVSLYVPSLHSIDFICHEAISLNPMAHPDSWKCYQLLCHVTSRRKKTHLLRQSSFVPDVISSNRPSFSSQSFLQHTFKSMSEPSEEGFDALLQRMQSNSRPDDDLQLGTREAISPSIMSAIFVTSRSSISSSSTISLETLVAVSVSMSNGKYMFLTSPTKKKNENESKASNFYVRNTVKIQPSLVHKPQRLHLLDSGTVKIRLFIFVKLHYEQVMLQCITNLPCRRF